MLISINEIGLSMHRLVEELFCFISEQQEVARET